MKQFAPLPLAYFYMSRPAPCPYISGRTEQMVFTDLSSAGDPGALHDQLSRSGFRRSQGIAYKPSCRNCSACVAVRVPVAEYRRSRNLQRTWRRNGHVTGKVLPNVAMVEHYELFHRYVCSRHGSGGMAGMSFEDYAAMVQDSPVPSRVVEFRDASKRLYGACLTDALDDGMSLVYSFFDPDVADLSPGTFMILWHIEHTKSRGLPYVYLGYWIADSPKMAYKARFRPLEAHGPNGWRPLQD